MAFLTRQEKFVIIFLLIGAICGVSYSYYRKFHPPFRSKFSRPKKDNAAFEEGLDALLKDEKSVNINTATLEEMLKLKGVGPVLAHRIIEYRTTNGLFREKDELKNVKGIGPKKFDAMKENILIE